jgi:hypothetical protein
MLRMLSDYPKVLGFHDGIYFYILYAVPSIGFIYIIKIYFIVVDD